MILYIVTINIRPASYDAGFLYISDEMTPAPKQSVGGGEKLVSGGVQSPSEIYAPLLMRRDLHMKYVS